MAEHALDFTQKEPAAKHLGSGRVPQVVKADVLTRSPAFDFRRFIASFLSAGSVYVDARYRSKVVELNGIERARPALVPSARTRFAGSGLSDLKAAAQPPHPP